MTGRHHLVDLVDDVEPTEFPLEWPMIDEDLPPTQLPAEDLATLVKAQFAARRDHLDQETPVSELDGAR